MEFDFHPPSMSILKSLRLLNALFVSMAVFAAYQKWISNSNALAVQLAVIVFFGVLFANALNNFLDYEVDIANQKFTKVTRKQRGWLARILGVISLLMIPTFTSGHLSSALYFLWFISVAYNLIQTKNKGWWGGILVSFSLAFSIMLPFWSKPNFSLSEFFQQLLSHEKSKVEFAGFFLIIFSLSLMREYLKDIQDASGDQQHQKKTWAPLASNQVFKGVIFSLIVLLWLGFAHLFILEKSSLFKLIWVFLPALSFPLLLSNLKNDLRNQASFYQKYLKFYLFIGTVTLFL
jgi:4-hydroxybenzoate polyprenyltransferase